MMDAAMASARYFREQARLLHRRRRASQRSRHRPVAPMPPGHPSRGLMRLLTRFNGTSKRTAVN